MNILVPAILVLWFSTSLALHQDDTLRAGAVVEELGRADITRGLFATEIRIDTDDFIRSNFEEGYHQVTSLIHNLYMFPEVTTTEKKIIFNSLRETGHYLKTLLSVFPGLEYKNGSLYSSDEIWKDWTSEISSIERVYMGDSNQFYTDNTVQRYKRGWINGIGYVMQTVVGTAIDEDIQDIKSELPDVAGYVEAFKRPLELSVGKMNDVLNITLTNMKKIHLEVDSLAKRQQVFENYIFLLHSFDKSVQFFKYLSQLSYEVNNDKVLLNQGFLPPIITLDHLRTVIRAGEEKLQMKFPISDLTEDNFYDVVRIAQVRSTSNSNRWILLLPFILPSAASSLFGLHPFPVSVKDKLVIPSVERYVIIHYEENVPAYYSLLDSLDSCSTYSHPVRTLCTGNTPRFPVEVPNCAVSIILGNSSTNAAEEVCSYNEFHMTNGVYTVLSRGKWYIYLTNSTMGSLRCPGTHSGKIYNHQGPIQLGIPCKFSTGKLTVVTTKIAHLEIKSSFSNFTFDAINQNMTIVKDTHYMVKSLDKSLHELDSLKNIHVPLMMEDQRSRFMSYLTSSLILLLVLAALCAVAFFIYRCRVNASKTATKQVLKVIEQSTGFNME